LPAGLLLLKITGMLPARLDSLDQGGD